MIVVELAKDLQLMREALEVLVQITNDDLPMRPMTIAAMRATITKLEQRLLRE